MRCKHTFSVIKKNLLFHKHERSLDYSDHYLGAAWMWTNIIQSILLSLKILDSALSMLIYTISFYLFYL